MTYSSSNSRHFKCAGNDFSDVYFGYPILLRKPDGGTSVLARGERSQNILQSLCRNKAAASWFRIVFFGAAPLGKHILSVLLRSPNPQMFGVYASWIIPSGAVVENEQVFRDWPTMEHPGEVVGSDLIVSPGTQATISVSLRPCPNPTGVSFKYVTPEFLFKWYSAFRHLENSTFLLLGGGVCALPLLES